MKPPKPSDPEKQFIKHNNHNLAYTIEGSGQHTIVGVPGLPGSLRDFRWLAPALNDHHRFIRLDMPGYGDSQRTGYSAMTIEQRASAVHALLESLDLINVTLLSHSSGSTVAAHLACHHSERVKNLVYLAPAGPTAHYSVAALRMFGRFYSWGLTRFFMVPTTRFLFRQMGYPSYLSDDERIYTALDAGGTEFKLHADNLKKVKQASMVAWASDDRISPSKFAKALAEMVTDGPRMGFDDGGHNIQKSKAIEIADKMLEFIQ
jgi:pimeloyl-ACP methyl ester carboxylesterase